MTEDRILNSEVGMRKSEVGKSEVGIRIEKLRPIPYIRGKTKRYLLVIGLRGMFRWQISDWGLRIFEAERSGHGVKD
jgi:hypothetical protein